VYLTTVAQDPIETARLAVQSVVDRLDADRDHGARDLLIEPHVVVRGTTGPAPAHRAASRSPR
jgi:DNA-binding LacI/PurR family transcriptional regulator